VEEKESTRSVAVEDTFYFGRRKFFANKFQLGLFLGPKTPAVWPRSWPKSFKNALKNRGIAMRGCAGPDPADNPPGGGAISQSPNQ
jgi:hypothetical protein